MDYVSHTHLIVAHSKPPKQAKMKLFNLLMNLLVPFSALAMYKLRPAPPPLQANGLCRDFRTVFMQFDSRCTLASHLEGTSTPTTIHLRAFDIDCNLLGENPAVSTKERNFDFNSQLPYVIVMERFWNATPPGFWYAGMGWGSDVRECWMDEHMRYVCSQVFQC